MIDEQRLNQIRSMYSSEPIGEFIARVDNDLTEILPELERLAEIEAVLPELVTEVRRLQRENHLLLLSRGVPSAVGMD